MLVCNVNLPTEDVTTFFGHFVDKILDSSPLFYPLYLI